MYLARWRRLAGLICVIAVCICFGYWRGQIARGQVAAYAAVIGKKATVTGRVFEDPSYDDRRLLDFRITDVQIDGASYPGTIRVKALSAAGLRRNDRVMVTGVVQKGFGNYQASVYYVSAQRIQKSGSALETIRQYFFAAVTTAFHDPQASLGLGFLVGLTAQLPQDVERQMRDLALTHIVVASGYNLTILLRLTRRLLSPVSKRLAVLSGAVLVLAMVGMTGATPSMVRAALVTFLSLSAWYYGRSVHPVLLVAMGAGCTAMAQPLYPWADLGWWLSFLSFAGVVLLAPLLQRRWLGDRSPPLLLQIVIETTAAQLLTLPLILWVFGSFSVVGLLANVLVVPVIPLAMLATFCVGAIGLIAPLLAGWLGLGATVIIGYILYVVRQLGELSWATAALQVSAGGMVALYVAIFAGGALLYIKTRHRYAAQPNLLQ
jgi:competence protein ComEC